jgi:hypothetical protein
MEKLLKWRMENMKTPEEIKKGLEYGVANCNNCTSCQYECPYVGVCSPYDYDVNSDVPQEMLADALTYIQQLEAQVPRWISVEDRLPPLGEVLICTRGNYVGVAWFHANGKFETGGGLMLDTKFVSHWMPLPEPPEEDAQ